MVGAVLRGDNEWIELGERSQIQDNSTLHTDPGFPMVIGDNCVIGHNVVLHGCTDRLEQLIGMGAIVLNGAKIGKNCLVGAGALVTEGKEFPDNSLIVGSPARAVRTLDDKARGDPSRRRHLRAPLAAICQGAQADRLNGTENRCGSLEGLSVSSKGCNGSGIRGLPLQLPNFAGLHGPETVGGEAGLGACRSERERWRVDRLVGELEGSEMVPKRQVRAAIGEGTYGLIRVHMLLAHEPARLVRPRSAGWRAGTGRSVRAPC